MKAVAIVIALVLFAGCGSRQGRADGRILKDSDGCAYLTREGLGDSSFINRLPDADASTCRGAKL